ncbi:hypothetical protein [Bradyrhizobium guangdongense]
MTAEKQVMEAVERAHAILARYVEPGERDAIARSYELLAVPAPIVWYPEPPKGHRKFS